VTLVSKKTAIYYSAVVLLALFLWGLLFYSIKAKYEHFSQCGVVENFSEATIQSEKSDQILTLPIKPLHQFGNAGFFWSEAAFHFRTTLMYAVDWYQSPSVLDNDQWQEYPGGVNSRHEYSILMEPVLGLLYKWAADESWNLIHFLMVMLPLFHVLLFFPIFHLGKILSGNSRYALAGVAVFATSSLAFSPLLSSFYVKETFSWFLFSIFLIGHFSYLHRKETKWLGVGSIGLYLFLISWHLAQFLMIPLLLVAVLALVWESQESKLAEINHPLKLVMKPSVFQPLIYLFVFLAAGFAPWLRERWFLAGVPTLFLVLWLALATIFSFFPTVSETRKKRMLWMAGGLVLILGFWTFNSRFSDAYSHVGGLLWHRVAGGFQKPVNPTEIPFDVRVFWVSPFSSPRWLVLKAGLGANGVLLLLATLWALAKSFRFETTLVERSIIWCTTLFLLSFVLVERLAPVFVFFGAVAVSLLGPYVERTITVKAARKFILPVLFAFPAFTLFYSMGGMIQLSAAALKGENSRLSNLDTEWDSSRASLFQWIRENTPGPGSSIPGESASFAGEIGMSPQLLLYTGRPVVLNSQFENKTIRSRYLEYLTVLFSENETELVEFIRKYQAGYLFINRDWATSNGKNSPKYLAGMTGDSSLGWNITRLHFFPSELNHFQPVYENDHYRVFKFVEKKPGVTPGSWSDSHNRWWNPDNFASSQGTLLDPAKDRVNLRDLDNMFRKLPEILGLVSNSVEKSWKEKHTRSGPRIRLASLQKKRANSLFESAVEGHSTESKNKAVNLEQTIAERLEEIVPQSGITLRDELLIILNGSPVGPRGVLEKILPYECTPQEYSLIGDLMVLLGEFEVAGEFYGKGGAIFPKPALTTDATGLRPVELQELLWEKTVLYLIAGGKVEKGRGLARFCATHVSPGSPRQRFFVRAGSIQTGNY